MAQILIKRDVQTVVDACTLLPGELAVALDTGKVYIGTSTGKKLINPESSTTAETADKLTAARQIAMTGDATWSTSFDGSTDATGALVLSDTGVIAGVYGNVTVDAKGRVTAVRDAKLADISDAGTVAGLNAGVATGNVPVLDANGKLAAEIIPSLALTDTFVVADEAAMLALNAQQGDVAIRSDEGKTYILASGVATVVANWIWLKTPESPVSSVNGRTGAVVVSKNDIGLENVANTADADKEVLSSTKLATPRSITLGGAIGTSNEPSFDGTADIKLNVTSVNAEALTGTIDCGVISEIVPPTPDPEV